MHARVKASQLPSNCFGRSLGQTRCIGSCIREPLGRETVRLGELSDATEVWWLIDLLGSRSIVPDALDTMAGGFDVVSAWASVSWPGHL